MLDESDEARERRRLIELIQSKGGSVTVRDLMRSSQRYSTAEAAEDALSELVKADIGRWDAPETTAQGGRPTCRFRLTDAADADTTPSNPDENRTCVVVNAVNGAECGGCVNGLLAEAAGDEAEDWGEV